MKVDPDKLLETVLTIRRVMPGLFIVGITLAIILFTVWLFNVGPFE